jgi:hypothetical protein
MTVRQFKFNGTDLMQYPRFRSIARQSKAVNDGG